MRKLKRIVIPVVALFALAGAVTFGVQIGEKYGTEHAFDQTIQLICPRQPPGAKLEVNVPNPMKAFHFGQEKKVTRLPNARKLTIEEHIMFPHKF